MRYSTISADGRLVAIAGRRGLAHYSSTSGRWKLFADDLQEQAFTVKGGLLWFHHVLIATVEVAKSWQAIDFGSMSLHSNLTFRFADTIIFSRSRVKQSKRPPSRNIVVAGCHIVTG